MKFRFYFIFIAAVSLCWIACDRRSREVASASKSPPLGTPDYKLKAQASLLPGIADVESISPNQGGGIDPAALYLKQCAACHQGTGQGVPGAFPPLDNSPYVKGEKVDRMASIMLYGLTGPIKVNGVQYVSAMAPFGAVLKDEELAAIATYIRSNWSNKAPAVDAKVFADARKKWGTRGPFQISELGEEK